MSDPQDVPLILTRLVQADYPPSQACLAYMAEHGFDPHIAVMRATVSPEGMLTMRRDRPDVANILQLLVGPFGIVAPEGWRPFRVAELKVGDVVINVEDEYKP